MDPGERRLSQFDGRSHHAGHDRARARILSDTYGVEDDWPVFCEEFRQWVVEDKFPAGRPALEEGRRHLHRGRRALRADEDPHPQRRPRGDRLSGRSARHPLRARGDGGPPDRRVPRNADEAGDHPGRAAAARESTSRPIAQKSPNASPIPRSATRSAGSVSTVRTVSRNSSCRRCATASPPARASTGSRSFPRSGAATAPACRRAARHPAQRSELGPTAGGGEGRPRPIRARSSPCATFLASWRTTRLTSPPSRARSARSGPTGSALRSTTISGAKRKGR